MSSVETRIIETQSLPSISLSSTEKAFLSLLLSKNLLVQYEQSVFEAELNGKKVTTKPDFHVINPRLPNTKGKYVEITTYPCAQNQENTEQDPKRKQRAILRKNGVTHVVLYLYHLANCQRYHQEYDFDVLHRRTKRKAKVKK